MGLGVELGTTGLSYCTLCPEAQPSDLIWLLDTGRWPVTFRQDLENSLTQGCYQAPKEYLESRKTQLKNRKQQFGENTI